MELFTENDQLLIENHIFEGAIERVFESNYYNVDIDANLNLYIEQLETDDVDLQLEENLSGIFEMEYNHIVPFYEAGSSTWVPSFDKRKIEKDDFQKTQKAREAKGQGSILKTPHSHPEETSKFKSEIKNIKNQYNTAKTREGKTTGQAIKGIALNKGSVLKNKAKNLLANMREKLGSSKLRQKLSQIKGDYNSSKRGAGGFAPKSKLGATKFVLGKESRNLKYKATQTGSAVKSALKKKAAGAYDKLKSLKPKKATA